MAAFVEPQRLQLPVINDASAEAGALAFAWVSLRHRTSVRHLQASPGDYCWTEVRHQDLSKSPRFAPVSTSS